MSTRQAHLRRARHWIVNRGWGGFLHEVWRRVQLKVRGEPLPGQPGPDKGPHPFDLAYNVDTTGLVWGESLDAQNTTPAAHYWATGYYGVAPSAFNRALAQLDLPWSSFTFVDIGCGKGRALLLASRYPFQRLLGVELSPALAEVAQRNLETFAAPWRTPGQSASVLVGDATAIPFPEGPLVLFLYHPFAAPVMRRFLEHVAQSLQTSPRPLYLLYANPELAPLLDEADFLERFADQHLPFSAEDIAADRFGSISEHIITYRARLA